MKLYSKSKLRSMKHVLLIFTALFIAFTASAQNDKEAVVKVLNTYKSKIEKLDTTGVASLFLPGARVFEGGKDEGGIKGYLDHHLAPELKNFKSFTYSDYEVDVKLNGNYAYTIETYIYTIILEKDASEIKSRGVATSVLRKIKNEWKIEMTHGSYRKINTVTIQKK